MLCYVMLCYVMSCHVMSCHIMSCHVMLCYVMLCSCTLSSTFRVFRDSGKVQEVYAMACLMVHVLPRSRTIFGRRCRASLGKILEVHL